jgi:hypothetical protein
MDPVDFLKKAFNVGLFIYEELNRMEENKAEAQDLARRILRLSGITKFLKTEVRRVQRKCQSEPLSPESLACLKYVEEFFTGIEGMLQARTGKGFDGGFFDKVKSATKEFFGAKKWEDQLKAANVKVTQVLNELEACITAQGLPIQIESAAVLKKLQAQVQKEHRDILEIKRMLQFMNEQFSSSTRAATASLSAATSESKKASHCWYFAAGKCM